MSSRILKDVPILVLVIAGLNAYEARATTQTTALPSVIYGPSSLGYTSFSFAAIPAADVAPNSTVDFYVTGQVDASLRCINVNGCGPITIGLYTIYSFSAGLRGDGFNSWNPYTTYGPTAYGSYLNLQAVNVASIPITLSYDFAKTVRVLRDPDAPAISTGSLAFYNGYVVPSLDMGSFPLLDFDSLTIRLLNPSLNIEYQSALSPVPEPDIYELLATGLGSLALLLRRRLKSSR